MTLHISSIQSAKNHSKSLLIESLGFIWMAVVGHSNKLKNIR
jgi:hypothetical protein